jgi:acetyltransferase-like isoleucine patch superfamily enzyme
LNVSDKRRTVPNDWYPGFIPENVELGPTSYIESSYSFAEFRAERESALKIGHAASIYLGTMFDVGKSGRIEIGDFALVVGVRFICDSRISIGDYALLSWNVLLMDNYRVPADVVQRRKLLRRVPAMSPRKLGGSTEGRPIVIGPNTWIGFDACVLPGVTVGEGSVVGARSVVTEDVPPFSVVAGNPARFIRKL